MIQLFEWYIEKKYSNYMACGYVAGHPKLPAGTNIHTSLLVQVEKDERQNLSLITRSGNQYHLAGEDICHKKISMTEKSLKVFGVHDFCKGALRLSAKKQDEKRREAEKRLSENGLFLEMLGCSCLAAYFKDAGGVHPLNVNVHVGTFQDSVLCRNAGVADFRYFPQCCFQSEVEPYHVSSNIERIHICNRGKDGIFFNRKILCEAQSVTLVEKQYFGAERLFSPDVYDGKCLYSESIKEE